MKLAIVLLSCCYLWVNADVLLCSDYLVSGFHGVNDTAMTSSSNLLDLNHDNSPYCGRLDYPGDNNVSPPKIGCWISGTNDIEQYIQGRHSLHEQWVKSYYLLYSMDGVTWTTVSSPDGNPKLFNGNVDTQSPVTSQVTPNVTARHLQINPREWERFISLRFDVSGLTAMTASIKDCAAICRNQGTCMAFTYRTANGVQWCTGYSAWIVVQGRIISDIGVFVNQDVLDMYRYKEDNETGILYNIVDVKMDQAKAASTCTIMHTQLLTIDTTSKMSRLQHITAGYFVLRRDLRFYVAGVYSSQTWSYNGGTDVIKSSLWSPGNPDPGQGHCVMLTQTGLASVDCQQQLFSICGN
ncbi:uncharacterized protein LOC117326613 [Pecten maximus]|uniref:uncharacterized protein LOC117326613 n=1 Tax=Pecten maximus TaxID=6579 RepID=UPI001458B068|nr:uncharacterized protein LOC117326613 [Pecten maximus]